MVMTCCSVVKVDETGKLLEVGVYFDSPPLWSTSRLGEKNLDKLPMILFPGSIVVGTGTKSRIFF